MSPRRRSTPIPRHEMITDLDDLCLVLSTEARECDGRAQRLMGVDRSKALEESGIGRGLRAAAHLVRATVLDKLVNEPDAAGRLQPGLARPMKKSG